MEGVFACVLYKNMDHAGRALLIYHVGKERPKAWKEFSKTVLSLPGKLYCSVSSNSFCLKSKLKNEQTWVRLGILELTFPTQWELLFKTSIVLCSIWSNFPILWSLTSFFPHIRFNHATGPSYSVLRICMTNLFMKEGKFVRAPGGSRTMIK